MAYIGIDLGTTNTLVAIKRYQSNPEVLFATEEDLSLEEEIRFFIPSVVAYKNGELIAGWKALELAKKQTVIFSIKRLMGRGYNEKDKNGVLIRELIEKTWGYSVGIPKGGTDEDIVVKIDGVEFTPQEISAAILREAVKVAKKVLREEIEGAVITVPAYFDDKQRWATRKAAQLAGIKVQKILSEPEASAKVYGLDMLGQRGQRTVAVYDLGGGTFDFTLLYIIGTHFDIQDLDGDIWLGGDDFDMEIVNFFLSLLPSNIKERVWSNPQWKYILKERAKETKHKLSNLTDPEKEIPIRLDDIPFFDSVDDSIRKISRRKFEELIAPMVAKTIKLVNDVLTRQACEPEDIDKVLLVGGSTRIPLVRNMLAKIFGEEKIISQIHPMKAVAEGAAIESSWLLDQIECPICKELVKKGVENCRKGHPMPKTIVPTERPYGIEKFERRTGRSTFDVIIPKGRNYPLLKPAEKEYTIDNPYARILKVPFYAGERDERTGNPYNEDIKENKHLGTIWMVLPKSFSIPARVTVRFNISEDRILEDISVLCRDNEGKEINISKMIVRASQEEKICIETENLLNRVKDLWETIEPQRREDFVQIACDAISLVIKGKNVEAEEKNKKLERELEKIKITPPGSPPEPPIPSFIGGAKNLLRDLRAIRQRYSWLPYFKATVQEVMEEERWTVNRAALLEFYHSQPGVEPSLDTNRKLINQYGRRTMEEIIVIAEGQLESVIQKKDSSEIEFRGGILIHLMGDRGLVVILETHAASKIAKELSKKPIEALNKADLSPSECISDAQKLEQAANMIEEFLKDGKVQEAQEVYEQVRDLRLKYIIASFIIAIGRKPTEEEIKKAKEEMSIITLPESIGGR